DERQATRHQRPCERRPARSRRTPLTWALMSGGLALISQIVRWAAHPVCVLHAHSARSRTFATRREPVSRARPALARIPLALALHSWRGCAGAAWGQILR